MATHVGQEIDALSANHFPNKMNPANLSIDFDIKKGKLNVSSSKYSSSVITQRGDEIVCRICLGSEAEGTPGEDGQPDKLICPCKCAGSMGMIHISCLREWVNSKRLVYKGNKVQSFFWKALECELC